MIHTNPTFKPQFGRSPLKPRQRDTVAEWVMDPVDADRLRSDQKARVDQPLVIAVAWPEHHAVLAEGDRLSIEVSGNVADRQNCHDAS